MKLTILAASGRMGRVLTRQALERGHQVLAIVRDPSRVEGASGLTVVRGDVHDPASITLALGEQAIVLSALGASGGTGVLEAGARAVLSAQPARVVWLGAYGSGVSGESAGWATRALLSLMGERLEDKVLADRLVLAARGTVFHAGPLSDGPLSHTRRVVGLQHAPRRFFPGRVSRATVAAAMIEEAESQRFAGKVALPLA